MKINIVTVGNLKEKYLVDGCKEYIKRISRFHTINMVEIEEEKLPKNYSELDISKCLVREGAKIEKYLKGFVVVLNIEGENLNSVEFAQKIEKISLSFDTITFVIGGSYGLSEDIKKRANMGLSFSKMTFPHEIARLLLCEQLYRAFNLAHGGSYHHLSKEEKLSQNKKK